MTHPHKAPAVSIGFVSLGCPKNTVDSERMLADLAQAGYLVGADPENADVVIVNTCGFIAPARDESLQVIRDLATYRRSGRVRRLVVVGCLAQRMGAAIQTEIPEVDLVAGLQWRDDLAGILGKTRKRRGPQLYLERRHADPVPVAGDGTRLRIGPSHWAYLRISEGCDHRCSFCTIPQIRGPFRSKSPETVVAEARELAASGVVELNLVAQDTTSYERDHRSPDGLARLLGQLNEVAGLAWIRLMYLYPTGISDRLIDTLATCERIVPYLDIPIQHCNDAVLRRMRRPDTHSRLVELIGRLRERVPGLVLRTTVIVGFPGETEGDFEELVDFTRAARFEALGCFPFYPETGTEAAGLPDQVPEAVRAARRDHLMQAQQEVAFAANRARIGQRLTCLVEGPDDDGHPVGRFYGQAPEIDGLCRIRTGRAETGTFVPLEVTDSDGYDLVGRVAD